MTKEQEIIKNMKILKISRKEAEELYISDHENIDTPEQKQYSKKAKNIKRYEKSDTPRKAVKKERKIDTNKKHLLTCCKILLEGMKPDVTINSIKNEAEIAFYYKDDSYTLKLVKHRPSKI